MLSMSNILVGNVNNTTKPANKAEGCWDGDTLVNLVLPTSRLSVPDMTLTIKIKIKEWRLQK